MVTYLTAHLNHLWKLKKKKILVPGTQPDSVKYDFLGDAQTQVLIQNLPRCP